MPKVRDLNPVAEIPRPIGGTDLAIPFRAFDKVGLVYGDTFGKIGGQLKPQVGGDDWRSPVIVWTEHLSKATDPIKMSSAVRGGAQLWDYPHNNDTFSTVLPTDAIEIDGRLYVWVMVTKGLANEQWCELACSDDRGATWTTGPKWSVTDFGSKRVMVTFDRKPGSDWVDIFTTGGLARDKGMLRFRCLKDRLLDPKSWEGWGWDGKTWGWGRYPSEILPGWKFGEICFRWIEGNAVLSGFDAGDYSGFIKVAADTDADWTRAKTYRPVTGMPRGVDTVPRLYGCYVHPDSKLDTPNGVSFIVSEWAQSGNPYRAMQYVVPAAIASVGPKTAPAPVVAPVERPVPAQPTPPKVITPAQPTPTPAPVQKDVKDMTAQEVLDLVARELAASGDVKLTLPDGRNVSLREAIGTILWKESAQLSLAQRPVDRKTKDDQFGHVLSARAEGIFNQELLVEIAKASGVDVNAVRARALGSMA